MTADRKNIILVSIDSLRADHCGFLGDERGLTPTMDALADEGLAFETAVAPGPQTFSSMPVAFTGYPRPAEPLDRYPGATHWERRLAALDEHMGRYASLPERLRERGYETAGFSPNPWASTASGFDRGFDVFEDFSGVNGGWLRAVADRLPGIDTDSKPVELALDLLTGSSFFARWESFYDDLDAVRQDLSEPYFLWVFLMDTHYPFLPGRAHRTEQSLLGTYTSALKSETAMRGNGDTMGAGAAESVRASYRDTVRSVDAFLDRLHTDAAGDDSALIVHADHGESFGEHGNYGHHHRQLYEENVHVPYLVHNAGSDATVADPASLATIPDVALSIARDGTVDPEAITTPNAVATSEGGSKRAVRDRRFKYLETEDGETLFDLQADPSESTDVADTHRDRCLHGRARLARFQCQREETTAISRAARAIATSGGL
ncbi:sulfatase-like hydrolase/transferase [Halodesulfurarchaeum formicicum]|uniref:Arylsulfatase n=1 Tax=Halodesulfurarchaeum formicicum TaxID=1873524 RepID=A0A1J1AAE3_9EURY|nr:sulfatase-like hydrolase/transferase [Halodesulfurarchaeum formicicum]APE95108.1 arylsulfatase [Halodesulfurarchaeum formicicum]